MNLLWKLKKPFDFPVGIIQARQQNIINRLYHFLIEFAEYIHHCLFIINKLPLLAILTFPFISNSTRVTIFPFNLDTNFSI